MLTLDQQLQAKEEGWKLVGGYVARAYNAQGHCPHPTVFDVVLFIRERARESEWHRDVYLLIPWSNADDALSFTEGWQLSFDGIVTRSIIRFPTNVDAQNFVQAGIEAGDPLHLKAIKTLAKRRLLYGDK